MKKLNLIMFVGFCIQLFSCKPFLIDNLLTTSSLGITPSDRLHAQHFLRHKEKKSQQKVITNPQALAAVARDALTYLSRFPHENFGPLGRARVLKTLRFIDRTVQADTKYKRPQRMSNPKFIKKHFGMLAWKPDQKGAQGHVDTFENHDTIRLTRYAIFQIKGSRKKTQRYSYALYQLDDDSIQKSYTKQQIIAGALGWVGNRKKVAPLAWLDRDGLEEALMQGSAEILFTDGTREIFGVDRNNGYEYDRSIKNARNQKRYWFFRRVQPRTPGTSISATYQQRSEVVLAGDTQNIGIGKIIAMTSKNKETGEDEMRLGVLADTGGAFTNNLYQLDVFAGIFPDRPTLYKHIRAQPMFARAFILYKK